LALSQPGETDERTADAAADRVVSGLAAVRSRPSADHQCLDNIEPLVIRRHASWEHRLLGDAPSSDLDAIAKKLPTRDTILNGLLSFLNMWYRSPESVTEEMIHSHYSYIRTFRFQQSGLLATYGELNTLPDYMANPAVLDAQPKSILLPILQAVRQEGYQRVNGLLGGFVPWPFEGAVTLNSGWGFLDLLVETKALDSLTANIGPNHTNHYTALVGRNACHFAPFSWYRWAEFYALARQFASQAHAATDPTARARFTYSAWLNHGYADHFLQDSFAAGHLVNKTLVMQWFLEWVNDKWYVPVAKWDSVKMMTTARQPGLAARGLYGPSNPGLVRDPQTAEEQISLQARMNMSGVRADGSTTQASSYQNYLAFLGSTVVQSASGALHDYFNASSLTVTSNAIGTPFQIWGDDTMLNGGDGVRIASDTAHMSQQSIVDILNSGQTNITSQMISDRFPNSVQSGGSMLPLQQWNDNQRNLAFSLFPDLHYYALRAFPEIDNISVDQ
jgi:hypothetical protein